MNSNQGIQAFDVTIQLPASAQPYGTGCGTPSLTLSASAAPVLGTSINLDLNNVPPSASLVFSVLGFVGIPSGVPPPVAPGCNQYLAPYATFLVLTRGASNTTFAQLPQLPRTSSGSRSSRRPSRSTRSPPRS